MQQIDLNHKPKERKPKITKDDILAYVNMAKTTYKRVSIMFLALICLLVAFFISNSIFKKSEANAKTEYGKYQNSILADKSDQSSSSKNTVIIPSDTAVDTDKLYADISKAESYIKSWFNWTNGKEYDAARKSVLNTFGKKSVMAQVFVKNVTVENGGKTVNLIDQSGLNMTVEEIKTYPLKIRDKGDNEYLSAILVNTNGSNGVSTTWSLVMTYTFDKENFITDAHVYFLNNR